MTIQWNDKIAQNQCWTAGDGPMVPSFASIHVAGRRPSGPPDPPHWPAGWRFPFLKCQIFNVSILQKFSEFPQADSRLLAICPAANTLRPDRHNRIHHLIKKSPLLAERRHSPNRIRTTDRNPTTVTCSLGSPFPRQCVLFDLPRPDFDRSVRLQKFSTNGGEDALPPGR
jgi:hypothetical protein